MVAAWDAAVWDVDRWATLALDELLLQEPTSPGRPIGRGDWRLVVEILLPDPGSALWDLDVWGAPIWSQSVWRSVTDRTRGMSWSRGSDEVYGRPRVGEIRLTLDNTDESLDPWTAVSAQFLAPGTVMRCGLISRAGVDDPDYGLVRWLPQWSGIVETWAPMLVGSQLSAETMSDRYVEVVLYETTRDLAQVDELALLSPVGAGEPALNRYQRLLDAAAWRYGLAVTAQNLLDDPSLFPLVSTVMAQNRLSELYLTADSSDTSFRSLRDGRAAVTGPEYQGLFGDADLAAQPIALFSYTDDGARVGRLQLDRSDADDGQLVTVAYRPETFRSQSADAEIANNVIFASPAGEQQFRQRASIQRYGERSYVRRDLLNSSGVALAVLAQLLSARRGLQALRIEALTVDTWARPERGFLATVSAEPGDEAIVWAPLRPDAVDPDDAPSILGYVASIAHRVTPGAAGSTAVWETDIRIDTRTVRNVLGAQLPETPL